MNYGVIAPGNHGILIRCAEHHPLRGAMGATAPEWPSYYPKQQFILSFQHKTGLPMGNPVIIMVQNLQKWAIYLRKRRYHNPLSGEGSN